MTIDELIQFAIHEDVGDGDHTSLACIPKESFGRAQLIVKEDGILAGVEVAKKVFQKIDADLKIDMFLNDGISIHCRDIVFTVEGSVHSILSSERLVLNFMQRMSGIATATNKLVSKLDGLNTKILDTRKTTPGLRQIEKDAVRIGGGTNHRMGLFDMIMIKDNHIDFAGGIELAIAAAQNYLKLQNRQLAIEIEARSIEDVEIIIKSGGVDIVMLDNFSPKDCRTAVNMINKRFKTEASGGITEDSVRQYAETGVDFISIGALTHHIKSLDMSLKAIK